MSGTEPRPWLASLLSLLLPGLGQAACGRLGRGASLFLAPLLGLSVAVVIDALLGPSHAMLIMLVAASAFDLLVRLLAAVDAAVLALRADAGLPRKFSARPLALVLLFVNGIMLQAGFLFLCSQCAFGFYDIPSISMAPNLVPGDGIFANRLSYEFGSPARGDVVVFRTPEKGRSLLRVKRVAAVPGDRVAVVEGFIFVNGVSLPQEDAPCQTTGAPLAGHVLRIEANGFRRYRILSGDGSGTGRDFPEMLLPDRMYFLIGDARGSSLDSRHFGPVPRESILGRAEYRVFPRSRAGLIDR